MKSFCILVIFLFCTGTALARQRKGSISDSKSESKESNREGKLFSLFTIVNFKNEPCTSTSSISSGSTSNRNGTCYTSSECSSKGGSAKGNCASGFGVCCVFMYSDTSQTTVNYNDTYLQNPNFPSAYGETSSLSYTINKCSSDICWLRLDFETFQNVGPTNSEEPNGFQCTDTLKVTVSSGQTVPELCGLLTGQHIYVDVGTGSSDSATLALAFSGASTQRKWEIKVAQIPCGQQYTPPNGCLQWHTGLTGQITTFNFADSNGYHLRNQDYSACIRTAAGMCCVEYTQCTSAQTDFSLGILADYTMAANIKSAVNTECITPATAPMTVSTQDYITIEGSGATCDTSNTAGSKYCGGILAPVTGSTVSAPVCDCTPPFYVGVKTDANPDATVDKTQQRGVCLNYRQIPCGGNSGN